MNLYTDRFVERGAVPAAIFQSINPIYIILLAPLFAGLWQMLGRRGLEPSAPAKFGIALVLRRMGAEGKPDASVTVRVLDGGARITATPDAALLVADAGSRTAVPDAGGIVTVPPNLLPDGGLRIDIPPMPAPAETCTLRPTCAQLPIEAQVSTIDPSPT